MGISVSTSATIVAPSGNNCGHLCPDYGLESDALVGAVAKRLVVGGPTPAQGNVLALDLNSVAFRVDQGHRSPNQQRPVVRRLNRATLRASVLMIHWSGPFL